MSDIERRILRRKRRMIAVGLDLSADMLDELVDCGALTPAQIQDIHDITSGDDQILRLLDIILLGTDEDVNKFLELLQKGNPWIYDEIRADARAESGTLEVEDQIREEARIWVHKKFGASKRFSEMDKKQIVSLVALKTQASKESWRRQLQKVTNDLAQLQVIQQQTTQQIAIINSKLSFFLREHDVDRSMLMYNSHDMLSTTDVLSGGMDKKDHVTLLGERVNMMIQRFTRLLTQKESMANERQQCLEMLGGGVQQAEGKAAPAGKGVTRTQSLTDIIRSKMTAAGQKNKKESADDTIRKLKSRLHDLEEELSQKEEFIEKMKELQMEHQQCLTTRKLQQTAPMTPDVGHYHTSTSPALRVSAVGSGGAAGSNMNKASSVSSINVISAGSSSSSSSRGANTSSSRPGLLFDDISTAHASPLSSRRAARAGQHLGLSVTCTYLDLSDGSSPASLLGKQSPKSSLLAQSSPLATLSSSKYHKYYVKE